MNHPPSLKLAPGTPHTLHGMTVFPLLSLDPVELPYILPEEAIADGALTISEIGDQGSVPQLLALNEGKVDILVLDGAQLIGAKQNRMASRTFVLPAGSKTSIPVSCIEQGRWHFDRRTFHGARQHSPSATRKSVRDLEAKLAREGVSADTFQLREAQSDVWASVASYSKKLKVRSSTMALDDVYEGTQVPIDEWVAEFPPVEGQVGLLMFRGARPLGLDVIGGRDLYSRLHDRLIRGYALDALAERSEDSSRGGDAADVIPDEAGALRFLDDVQRATRTEAPTVGKGSYAVLSGTVVGAELIDEDRLAHRSAFGE
ncbi:MAG: ARPP-1 family domain-containing protein [Gemmatimonadota bacterium]